MPLWCVSTLIKQQVPAFSFSLQADAPVWFIPHCSLPAVASRAYVSFFSLVPALVEHCHVNQDSS